MHFLAFWGALWAKCIRSFYGKHSPAPDSSAPSLSRRSNRAHASPSAPACRALATALGCPPRLLVLRAFRATAPAELQELLRDEGVMAPDDPVMQELAPLVAAVQTLPPVTRQLLLLAGSGLPLSPPADPACETAEPYATTHY